MGKKAAQKKKAKQTGVPRDVLLTQCAKLIDRSLFSAAITPLLDYVKTHSNDPQPQILLGQALVGAGHLAEGIQWFRRLHQQMPGNPWVAAGLALALERAGELDEAYMLLAPRLVEGELNPNSLTAFASICVRSKRPADARHFLALALARGDWSQKQVSMLCFAYGECLEAEGNLAAAFEAYAKANDAAAVRYSPEKHEALATRICTQLGAEQVAPLAEPSPLQPVFIIGMPRSGTSLTEQILACHPQVAAAGEQSALRLMTLSLQKLIGEADAPEYPECLPGLDAETAQGLQRWYVDQLTRQLEVGAGVTHLTDKMPANYLYLGLMARLFPRARLVYCKRDPVEVCWSAYRLNFGVKQPFSTRFDWLAHRYQQHARLMAHWQQVIPQPMYTLDYAALCEEPERIIRELLDFCELPFDAACLHPEKSERHVHTASYAQVKSPIQPKPSPAQRLGSHLDPLREALASPNPLQLPATAQLAG